MNPWKTTWIACLGYFMVMLDVTIVTVATPTIAGDLHASVDEALWVFNAYILALGGLLLTGGRLGDRYGARRMFLIGIPVFTVASALCGAATSPGWLIAARAAQGAGAALMTPQTLSLIAMTVPPARLGFAFGLYGAVAGAATIIGPTLGGLLTDLFGWPSIFYLNLPIGVAVLAWAVATLPRSPERRAGRLDLPGVVLVTAALGCVTFGMLEGDRYGWGRVWSFVSIPALLAVGVLLVAAFAWSQRRVDAMIPVGLLRDRDYLTMNLVGVTVQFAVFGLYIPITFYLQGVLGLGPVAAGLTLASMSVTSMAAASLVGRLTRRFGLRPVLLTGLGTLAAALLAAAVLAWSRAGQPALLPVLMVAGVGTGLVFAPLTALALAAVPPTAMGVASGMLNTTQRIGSLLAGATLGIVLADASPASATLRGDSFSSALGWALVIPVVLLLAGIGCALLGGGARRAAAAAGR